MPNFARTLVLAASLGLAGMTPSTAASRFTQTFLANVVPNVDFLDRSSRFALTNAKSRRLRAFALTEARNATRTADALYDWMRADAPAFVANAQPAPSTSGLDTDPTASTKATWPALLKPEQTSDTRLPLGQEDLDSMEGLTGADFDAQYKSKQADALQQVEADFRSYIATGDDPTLSALAKRELPKITAYRAALTKL